MSGSSSPGRARRASTSSARRGGAERSPDRVPRDEVDHREGRRHQDPQRDQQPPQAPDAEPYPRTLPEPWSRSARDGQRHRHVRCHPSLPGQHADAGRNELPGVSNLAPLPKVCTTLPANGTMSALEIRPDSAESQARHPASPGVAIADFTALSYAGSEIAAKLFPAPPPRQEGHELVRGVDVDRDPGDVPVPGTEDRVGQRRLVLAVRGGLHADRLPLLHRELGGGVTAAAVVVLVEEGQLQRLAALGANAVASLVQPAWSSRAAAACGSEAARRGRPSRRGRRPARSWPAWLPRRRGRT